jgi:hypothetical protein
MFFILPVYLVSGHQPADLLYWHLFVYIGIEIEIDFETPYHLNMKILYETAGFEP